MPYPTTDPERLQHFDDVKEKIGDLMPQLDRLKQSITTSTVDGDPEETKRRSELARCVHKLTTAPTTPNCRSSTFEKIEQLSGKLLAKGTVARFLDKGGDSNVVAKLIERLREAIVCYQVGDCSTPVPVPSVVDRGTDFTTTSDVLSNHSSRSNVFPIVSGTGAHRSVSQVIVRCTLEASGGNPLQHDRRSTCSWLNRNPHR